jgi:thioredoxin reductase (NADPH)
LRRLRQQIKKYSIETITGEATVRRARGRFRVQVGPDTFESRSIILATGLLDIQPDIENLDELRALGILGYCPICDGYEHLSHHVGLVIKGNQAYRKVKFISGLCPRLTLIPIREFSLSNQLKNFIHKKGLKISAGPLEKISFDEKTLKVSIRVKNKRRPIKVDFVYISLGVFFDDTAIKHLQGLRRTGDGFIQTNSHQETSIPGLYAVGDCVNALAQVSVAIGQAALASTRIHHDLFFKGTATE